MPLLWSADALTEREFLVIDEMPKSASRGVLYLSMRLRILG